MCNHLQTINITNMLNKIIDKIKKIYYQSTSERYCNYLRNKGIRIGGVRCCAPRQRISTPPVHRWFQLAKNVI